jgi:hypothetical protein
MKTSFELIIKNGYGARPACRSAANFVRETRNEKTIAR